MVGRLDVPELLRRDAADEISHQLTRSAVVTPAQLIGKRFQPLLQLHAGERAAGEVLLGSDADHDAGVGVALLARILTHAVRHDPLRLGGRRHYASPWTHAETVDRTAVGGVVYQFVVGCPQLWVSRVPSQSGAVDQRLRVLDSKADRERLRLDEYTPPVQHAEGVAGAVPERQHHMPAVQRFAVVQDDACDPSVVEEQVDHLVFEPDFPAQRDDLFADRRHHPREPERSDVGLADVQNLFGRAGANELLHDFAAVEPRVLDLAVQLAVGKQPGAALPELHVRFRGQRVLAPQPPRVLGSPSHLPPALEDDGPESHLGEEQRGKDAAGAEPDDQRPFAEVLRHVRHGVVTRVGRRTNVGIPGQPPQDFRLVAGVQVDDVDEQDSPALPARIVAALEDAEIQEIGGLDLQLAHDGGAQCFAFRFDRQRQFGDADHVDVLAGDARQRKEAL